MESAVRRAFPTAGATPKAPAPSPAEITHTAPHTVPNIRGGSRAFRAAGGGSRPLHARLSRNSAMIPRIRWLASRVSAEVTARG